MVVPPLISLLRSGRQEEKFKIILNYTAIVFPPTTMGGRSEGYQNPKAAFKAAYIRHSISQPSYFIWSFATWEVRTTRFGREGYRGLRATEIIGVISGRED